MNLRICETLFDGGSFGCYRIPHQKSRFLLYPSCLEPQRPPSGYWINLMVIGNPIVILLNNISSINNIL